MINNPNITNVLNPKSLEKQMKIYDTRLQVLQAEVEELARLKAACSLLLGAQPGEATAAPVESVDAKAPKKGKKEAKAEGTEIEEAAAEPAVDPAVAQFESNEASSLEN